MKIDIKIENYIVFDVTILIWELTERKNPPGRLREERELQRTFRVSTEKISQKKKIFFRKKEFGSFLVSTPSKNLKKENLPKRCKSRKWKKKGCAEFPLLFYDHNNIGSIGEGIERGKRGFVFWEPKKGA